MFLPPNYSFNNFLVTIQLILSCLTLDFCPTFPFRYVSLCVFIWHKTSALTWLTPPGSITVGKLQRMWDSASHLGLLCFLPWSCCLYLCFLYFYSLIISFSSYYYHTLIYFCLVCLLSLFLIPCLALLFPSCGGHSHPPPLPHNAPFSWCPVLSYILVFIFTDAGLFFFFFIFVAPFFWTTLLDLENTFTSPGNVLVDVKRVLLYQQRMPVLFCNLDVWLTATNPVM